MNPTLTLRDLVRTKTFEIQPACCSDSYFQRPFAMGGEAVESKRDKDEARGGGDGMAAQPPPKASRRGARAENLLARASTGGRDC